METYLIIGAIFSFIIGLCNVLGLGKLIRIILIKFLYPNAKLKEIESFEKSTKSNYSFNLKSNKKDL
jgi:hypothetical protein